MARQEQIFAQTIADMKRAMLRKGDDSESDDLIDKPTNRGNKLKRKAKFVEEGRLDLANSVQAYRKKVNYNGFFREVISKNPVRVDPDGDVVEDEGDDSGADVEDLEEDPYGEVKIEHLLMPLTSAAELQTHPSLSIPYKAKILDEMIQNARDMLFREEDTLWRIKQLANEFRGDSTWMPCGSFETPNDFSLLGPASASVAPSIIADAEGVPLQSTGWESMSNAQLLADLEEAAETGVSQQDMTGISVVDMEPVPRDLRDETNATHTDPTQADDPVDTSMQEEAPDSQHISKNDASSGEGGGGSTEAVPNGYESHINGANGSPSPKQEEDTEKPFISRELSRTKSDVQSLDAVNASEQQVNGEGNHDENDEEEGGDADEDEASQPQHRMTTRAKAQAANSPGSTSRPMSPSNAMQFIHPFFLPPETALSTKEVGLPFEEADDTRRLVCAFAQKQEEVCRGASRLYNGLLRARKMRDDVLEWCQAEGHVGEMSDGEDWYDREKWNLSEDLKKGEELDEEEANVTGKKTRNRRHARDA